MSRSLTTTAVQAANAQETGEVFLILLTISHASLSPSIRVVGNTEDIVSNGETFLAFPFEITLPDDAPESVAQVSLKIDNVDRQIVDAIRSISSPPTVSIDVILASDPDTIEAGPFNMTLLQSDYDVLTVTGELVFEDVLNEPFPGDSFDPVGFPGLF